MVFIHFQAGGIFNPLVIECIDGVDGSAFGLVQRKTTYLQP